MSVFGNLMDEADEKLRAMEAERDIALAWKTEQLQVESECNPQAVGAALGIQLGCSMRAGILPAIVALQVRIAELESDKERLLFTLESSVCLLTMALDGMPNGAFRNAVREEEMPNFKRTIDAARQKAERK